MELSKENILNAPEGRVLEERIKSVLKRIERACEECGRDPSGVRLLGASKGVSVGVLKLAAKLGLSLFGESRVQEFLPKFEELRDSDVSWHFIGNLQSNKVRQIIGKVELIHSLDRVSLLEELSDRASRANITQRALIEVNFTSNPKRGGVMPENLKDFAKTCLDFPNIEIVGLMCIAPLGENPRPYFRTLRELKENLEQSLGVALKELSMGMSSDFEDAIKEGSSIVRIGSLLFN
ncbi:MAG: YggS family pyridoxal phosphate-dependent enzyme [Aquificaceae bacterium]|nr:YggS family pyridoxal phosphate-dependent enzyme [Aquificaceae bacterium]